MQKRRLGQSGIEVSVIGLGCNNLGFMPGIADAVVPRALDEGITLFDTADSYGRGQSELELGKALGHRRVDVVIATKFGGPMDDAGTKSGAAARYVIEACEASLSRLGTDWIDLYQLHRPDPRTPIEETLEALDSLARAGKVRAIGCSNLKSWQVTDANWRARTKDIARFVCAQDNYSLLERRIERELVPALEAEAMGLLPYLPLASGLLSGKYKAETPPPEGSRMAALPFIAKAYLTEEKLGAVDRLARFAQERGHTILELAFGWLLSRPVVSSVIAGATRPDQIGANAAAAAWSLSPDELAEIDRIVPVPS